MHFAHLHGMTGLIGLPLWRCQSRHCQLLWMLSDENVGRSLPKKQLLWITLACFAKQCGMRIMSFKVLMLMTGIDVFPIAWLHDIACSGVIISCTHAGHCLFDVLLLHSKGCVPMLCWHFISFGQLAHGADPSIVNQEGQTPLDLAQVDPLLCAPNICTFSGWLGMSLWTVSVPGISFEHQCYRLLLLCWPVWRPSLLFFNCPLHRLGNVVGVFLISR